MEIRNESLFTNNRIPNESIVSRNEKVGVPDTIATPVNVMPSVSNLPVTVNSNVISPKPPIRILSKSSQSTVESPILGHVSKPQEQPGFPNVSVPHPAIPRPPLSIGANVNNHNSPNIPKPQNFNPNPNINPYQNLNAQKVMTKSMQGLYGSQQNSPRFSAPMKERTMPHTNMNQYRPRSPAAVVRNQQPQGVVINNVYQRTAPVSAPGKIDVLRLTV